LIGEVVEVVERLVIEKGMEKFRRLNPEYGTLSNVTFVKVKGHHLSIVNLALHLKNHLESLFCKNELVSTQPFFMTYL
jgi:hypothetical protein